MESKLFEGHIVKATLAQEFIRTYYQSMIHDAEKSIDGLVNEEDLKMVENRIKKLQEDWRTCSRHIQCGEPFQLTISIDT
jgi:hypothetical protein